MTTYIAAICLLVTGVIIFGMSYQESHRQQYRLAEAVSQDCIPLSPEDVAHLKEIGRAALEDALKDHVTRLFESWMKDDTSQPARAQNGIRQGVRAYLSAKKNLESWNSSICY